jgi:hypothetical protein
VIGVAARVVKEQHRAALWLVDEGAGADLARGGHRRQGVHGRGRRTSWSLWGHAGRRLASGSGAPARWRCGAHGTVALVVLSHGCTAPGRGAWREVEQRRGYGEEKGNFAS